MLSSSQSAHHSSRRKQKEPTSPWRKLLVRSRSLEGVSSDDDENDNKRKKKSVRQARREKSWGWLLTPPTRLVGNPLHRTNPPPAKRHLFSPSNLTMFLLRLNEAMPQYCKLLSDPSVCQEAANLLDSSTIVASSPQNGSPASNSSSPSVSPTSFFRKTADGALEGEWETYASPFLLMTGAEALYSQMELQRLSHLYKTIQTDLKIVEERLCDPWLAAGEQQQSTTATRTTAHQAASSMARVFESFQSFLNIKCQLVDIQTTLFAESSQEPFGVKVTTLVEQCRDLLPSATSDDCDETPVKPMFISLTKEIKARIALLETASHLEQCQFTASILSARKLKQNLTPSSNTVVQSWLKYMLERFVSIMPVYFDRINAFASPLYGFDTMHMWADSKVHPEHYDEPVLDFLRKHESKGGPSMAVCIVIDAINTNNVNFARAFVVRKPPESSNAQLTAEERERKEWQAVYMRSTVHYNSSNSPMMARSPSHGSGSISTIMRRSKGSSFRKGSRNTIIPTTEDDFTRSLANIMRPVSQDSTTTAHHYQMSVMEYPPATGPVSWPYTEWTLLVDLVKEDLLPAQDDGFSSSVQAVTYRQPEPEVLTKKPTSVAFGLPPPVQAPPPPSKPTTDSSFHLVRLSEYMTMIAIVKCEDDGKWHLRRTRGHTDEEIRVFLNEMALKLKVSVLFDKDSVETVKTAFRQNESHRQPPEQDLVRAWQQWDEANTQEFLRELKKSFQLRPQSPYMENLRNRGAIARGSSGRRRKKQRAVDYSESAMAFFMGPDLQL